MATMTPAMFTSLNLQPDVLPVCADVLGDWRPTMYILSALLFPSAVLYFAGAYVKGKDFRAEQPPGDGDERKLSPSGGVAEVAGTPFVCCSWHPPSAWLAFTFCSAVGTRPVQALVHVATSGLGQWLA